MNVSPAERRAVGGVLFLACVLFLLFILGISGCHSPTAPKPAPVVPDTNRAPCSYVMGPNDFYVCITGLHPIAPTPKP